MEAAAIPAKRDPPIVSYGTQSKHFPPPSFLMKRPARKQVEEFTKRGVIEDMGEYNIWYGKYASAGRGKYEGRGKGSVSETRCCVATDTGSTRGNDNPGANICYLFAQGRCHLGSECSYLHCIPGDVFDARLDTAKDSFGRTRHGTDSDNMGGVGNFSRESTTLYVGGLKSLPGDDIELRVRDNFGEFGELACVKAFPKRAIAFVTYINRSSAEFAKIAMADQSLGNGDVLNVRWATEDPNPKTIELKKRKTEEKVLLALKAKGYGTSAEAFDYPIDYQVPKKAKTADDDSTSSTGDTTTGSQPPTAGADNVSAAADKAVAYPDTSEQYTDPHRTENAATTQAAGGADDAFAAAREEEEKGEGGANWLRDAAWEAVRKQDDSHTATAGVTSSYGVAQWQQWQMYYAQHGYTLAADGTWQLRGT